MEKDLKLREAAQMLRVCPRTIRNYIKSGKLPAIQSPTGRWWIKQIDLEQFRKGVPAEQNS